MSYAIFQYLALAAILAWSLGFAARRLFPRTCRAVQAKLAQRLAASRRAALRALGAKLAPRQAANADGCGSGDGCSSCGGCAPPPTTAANDTYPLVFHPRGKR